MAQSSKRRHLPASTPALALGSSNPRAVTDDASKEERVWFEDSDFTKFNPAGAFGASVEIKDGLVNLAEHTRRMVVDLERRSGRAEKEMRTMVARRDELRTAVERHERMVTGLNDDIIRYGESGQELKDDVTSGSGLRPSGTSSKWTSSGSE